MTLSDPSFNEGKSGANKPRWMIFASRPSSLLKMVAVGNAQKSPVPITTWRHFPGKPQTVRGMLMLKQMLLLDSAFSRFGEQDLPLLGSCMYVYEP